MRASVFLFIAFAFAGCRDADSPEAQVHRTIHALEAAAEARDVGDLLEHVSAQYRDAYGQGVDEAARYVRGYFIANQRVRLITDVEALEFLSNKEARAKVLVRLGADESEGGAALDLIANAYEFDVTLVREGGDWRVTYADWRRR